MNAMTPNRQALSFATDRASRALFPNHFVIGAPNQKCYHSHLMPMDNGEVESILAETLAMYRSRTYVELAACVAEGRITILQLADGRGSQYNLEVCFF
jgi:hypothetical protein